MRKFVYKYKFMLLFTLIFRSVASLLQVYNSVTLSGIIDAAVAKNMDNLKFWILISFAVFAGIGFSIYFGNICRFKYIEKTMTLLKAKIFQGIMRRDYKLFKQNNTSDYISNMTNDTNLFEKNYLSMKIDRIGYILMLLASIVVMISINLWLTVATIVVSMLIMMSPIIFQGFIARRQGIVSEQFSAFTDKVKDVLMGYEIIKTFKVQDRKENEFLESNKMLERKKYEANKMISLAETVSGALSISVQVIIVSVASFLVFYDVISAGNMVAILTLSGQIVGPFGAIVSATTSISGMAQVNKKLIDLAETPSEGNKQYIKSFVNNIRITNLSYGYEQDKPVLKHVTCEFKKGKKYAIVGTSGSGKSTLLQLIMGYDDNYDGYIWIDGQNMKDISNEARYGVLTIMHQNVYMFSGGLYENVTLGRHFEQEEIDRTLKQSGVTEFLKRLSPDTIKDIGENGNKLSGGQRQRIAIARALLNGSQVLLLDEAMSSLDPRTSREIEGLILSQENMTVIAVTHKLSSESLKDYDEILVLDGGYLVEKGNFETLMEKNGVFARMCQNYSKGEYAV